jgi:hypothetical protein
MIDIKIEGAKFSLPKLTEIKLSKFIEYLDLLEEKEPTEEDSHSRWLEFYTEHIAFWTGADIKLIRRCKAEDVVGIYSLHCNFLMPSENKTYNCFKCINEIYYLPQKFMEKSTIEDFAEADEYEKQMSEVIRGNYRVLPKVAAVICRKEGEKFDDYDVEKRAEMFENELSADDFFQIGFFLQRQSEKLLKDFQIYMTSQTLATLKLESKT